MKKFLLLFLTVLTAYSQQTEIRRGGGVVATNSPGNGTPALFMSGVTNADGTITYFWAAPSATATNAQAPSTVLSNLVVTVGSNVTNAHANIGTISVGTLYPNAVLSNLVVNVANTVTNVNANQGNITSGTLNISSGALLSNVVFFGTTTNRGVLIFTNVATAGGAPPSGQTKVFGSNDTIYSLNSAGTLTDLGQLGTGSPDAITNVGATFGLVSASHILYAPVSITLTNVVVVSNIIVQSSIDGANQILLYNQDTSVASDTSGLKITYDVADDPQARYITFSEDIDNEEIFDFIMSQTKFDIGSSIHTTIAGPVQLSGLFTNTGSFEQYGSALFTGPTTFTNKVIHAPFIVPNNVGTVYGTNGNLQIRTLTNSSTLSFLEMGDGQTIELHVTNRFDTNVLAFSGLSNTNFIDGFFGLIPSNRLVKFWVQRVGTHTNVSYQGPVTRLLAGSNIALSTNDDTSITIGVTGLAGGVDGRFDTLIVTNWTRHIGGVSNMLWVFNSSSVSNMSWVFNSSSVSNMLWVFNGGPVTNSVSVTTLGNSTNLGIGIFGSTITVSNTGNFLADIDVTGLAFHRTNLIGLGTNNLKWLNVTNYAAFLENVRITGGLTNTSGEVSLSAGNFLISAFPQIHSMVSHQFKGEAFFTNGLQIISEQLQVKTNNITWQSTTLAAASQQTNVIVDFWTGVWDAGNWNTNLNFIHATNGIYGLSNTPTNHYTTIKIQPNVNTKVRFPTTWNLLGGLTNNSTISNGSKAHIVFSSNGSSQTNVDVAINGTQFP